MSFGQVCVRQYMSSVDGCICEKFLILVIWGSSPGSVVEHHYGCLQECSLLFIVRTIWQKMYDIQPHTTLVTCLDTVANINKG